MAEAAIYKKNSQVRLEFILQVFTSWGHLFFWWNEPALACKPYSTLLSKVFPIPGEAFLSLVTHYYHLTFVGIVSRKGQDFQLPLASVTSVA